MAGQGPPTPEGAVYSTAHDRVPVAAVRPARGPAEPGRRFRPGRNEPCRLTTKSERTLGVRLVIMGKHQDPGHGGEPWTIYCMATE